MAQNMNNSDFSIYQESERRKGPWTAEEDKLLIDYVKLYGEGRWNHVARLSGLKRNGKSCRLRWVNYLRPDLKRGQITPYEESIIVELHAKWGNRWSTIAKSLPGRTDNEIKNYWRTHFKNKSKSHKENPEKTRARLLKKQQFRLQQQQQQSQQQQQLMILRSKDQIETEIFDGSGNSKMPNFDQLGQEIIAYPFDIDNQGLYYPIFDGYANVPDDSNEDYIAWDYGLWNLDYCHNYVDVRDGASVSY